MPSITVTTPASGATVAHSFPATGTYDIEDLGDVNGVNTVRSDVTQGTTLLDTKTVTLRSRHPVGTWTVAHTVSGSETLTGCVVTATLLVDGVEQASAASNNITISG